MLFSPSNALTEALFQEGFLCGGHKNEHYNLELILKNPTNRQKTRIINIRNTTPEKILSAAELYGFNGEIKGYFSGQSIDFNSLDIFIKAKQFWRGQKTGFILEKTNGGCRE